MHYELNNDGSIVVIDNNHIVARMSEISKAKQILVSVLPDKITRFLHLKDHPNYWGEPNLDNPRFQILGYFDPEKPEEIHIQPEEGYSRIWRDKLAAMLNLEPEYRSSKTITKIEEIEKLEDIL